MKIQMLDHSITNGDILAISGSLRTDSSNTRILEYLATLVPSGIKYHIYSEMAALPHFNPVLDTDTPPASVVSFRQLVKNAAAVIICSPEYAFGVPGSLKNALDWTVSSGDFVDKKVALIVASSVGDNAYASLLLTLGAINANVQENCKLLIPFIRSKMDTNGTITDDATRDQLQAVFENLINTAG